MTNELSVYWEAECIGKLWQDEKRQFIFQYSKEWIKKAESLPISSRLKLQAEPFGNDESRIFFSNLLPEENIRKLLSAKFGVSDQNDFGLLEAIGGECAGALSILPPSEEPIKEGGYTPLTNEELDKMIATMPKRPLINAHEGVRLSLAGAQNKLPVYIEDEKLFLPTGAFSSSHILKPQIPQYDGTVDNEAYCMLLAKECGLPVPGVRVWKTPKSKAYVVERFDRVKDESSKLRRIHQEDFCQALGHFPHQKYEREGGPSFKDCFEFLNENVQNPAVEKIKLLKWGIFNFLIGNSDAHAKNLSILITKEGPNLAPFYDLMSTCIYDDVDKKMAMKIGGYYERHLITKRHWEAFAAEADIKGRFVVQLCQETAKQVSANADTVLKTYTATYGDHQILHQINDFIKKTSESLLRAMA